MAKANAFNLSLANGVNFPLANATGNLPTSKMNSGASIGGAFWNGDSNGVWVSPFGSAGFLTGIGIAKYYVTNGINSNSESRLCITVNAGAVQFLSGASGNLLSGQAGAPPVSRLVQASNSSNSGSFNMVVTSGPSSLALSATACNPTGTTGSSQSFSLHGGFFTANNNSTRVIYTIPSFCAAGNMFRISGLGSQGWRINQNAGQTIRVGNSVTTSGVGGYISSTNQYDSIELVCIVADTQFSICGQPQSSGLTIV